MEHIYKVPLLGCHIGIKHPLMHGYGTIVTDRIPQGT